MGHASVAAGAVPASSVSRSGQEALRKGKAQLARGGSTVVTLRSVGRPSEESGRQAADGVGSLQLQG
eukprot:3941129-Rhodomonas_salina.7